MRHIVNTAFGLVRGAVIAGPLIVGAVTAGLPAAALAGGAGPVVVELYTSQGCSSCPPADEFLAELAEDPRVIALSLHVDYWDYIGWTDAFAQGHFTERQKSYARYAGSRMIYTPQMVIGGLDRVEGTAPADVVKLIGRHLAQRPAVALALARQGGDITIRADAPGAFATPASVYLVRYIPSARVTIEKGENAGRTVDYRNVVTDWTEVGSWSGDAPLDLSVALPGDEPAVVILQEQGPAAILAAARLDTGP